MDEETLDEILNGRLCVFQKRKGYRFSLDAVLLARFVSLKAKSRAVDLGTGSAVIPLILAVRFPESSWTGLEIQKELAALALKSIEFNDLANRIAVINGDARKIEEIFPGNNFDAVTFNPPYRKINSGRINPDGEKAVARHEIQGSLKDFLRAAAYLLKPGGRVFTIYPARRLAELISLFRDGNMEPKRMKLVFSTIESGAEFVLMEGRKNSGEELKIEPSLIIYDKDGKYTMQMKSVFSDLASAAFSGGG